MLQFLEAIAHRNSYDSAKCIIEILKTAHQLDPKNAE